MLSNESKNLLENQKGFAQQELRVSIRSSEEGLGVLLEANGDLTLDFKRSWDS